MGYFNTLIQGLRQDKKRAGTVVALLAVGLLLWGRLMLKQVPRTASADEHPTRPAEAAQEPADEGPRRATVTLSPPAAPTRNLFTIDPDRYDRLEVADNPLSGAKSAVEITEESIRMSVAKAAEGLRLQSVTQGEVPAAFINGRLIRVGGSIDGFTLLACDERTALLEKQGIKVRLGM